MAIASRLSPFYPLRLPQQDIGTLKTLLKSLPKILGLSSLIACGGVQYALAADQPELAGYDRFDVQSAHRSERIAASLWYPMGSQTYRGLIGDNALFKGTYAYVGAGLAKGRHPLILLSHGSGGNMDALSWLSSGLALKGAMILAVNHPGSRSGDSSPRRSLDLGSRAKDLSAALDQLLADPVFASYVDPTRIYGLGFSLGGATTLNLAGLQFDGNAYKDYCIQHPQSADCIFLAKGDVDLSQIPEGFSANSKDPRLSAVVAVDPGFTYAANMASLKPIDIPVLLISLGQETLMAAADVSKTGSNLANALTSSNHVVVAPANHFTFLAECKAKGEILLAEEGEDPVCTDPKGVKRGSIHQKIIDQIAKFLML